MATTKERATGSPMELAKSSAEPGAVQTTLAQPEIYKGTKPSPKLRPRSGPAFSIAESGEVTLNFVNADIHEAIDTILGDILGVPYVIDPRVTGSITIRSAKPIRQDALIPTLENLLAVNGAALVASDGGYKIVPTEAASTSLPPAQVGAAPGSAFGVHVMPLHFASAASLREVLEPLVPPGRVLRVDPARNLIIFSGTGGEAAQLQDLIDIFDVDWMAGRSFGLFPVQFANPRTVAQELVAIFGPMPSAAVAQPAAPDAPPPVANTNGGAIRFVPIDRMRAVLAIAEDATLIDAAKTWVERLDRGEGGDGRRVYVYRVQNGRAADLGRVLGQLFPATVAAVGREGPRASLPPGASPGETGLGGADQSQAAAGQYGNAAAATGGEMGDVAATGVIGGDLGNESGIGTPLSSNGTSAEGSTHGIHIVPDIRNNAIVISATPEEYRQIESALHQLDVTPLQVLIEATIAEVTLTDQLRYGLEWFFESGNSSVTFAAPTTAAGIATGAINPVFPGFNYVFSSSDAKVVLNALTQITNVKVISSPQLMVLNNETARLQVGDQVPIATQEVQSVVTSEAPIVNTIEYRDTGVILSVSPRVNEGGLVTLDIIQEVSQVTQTTTSTLNSPTIQQRRVKSTVAVQSGETVALGGLIRDGTTKGVTGVPLLSEIPVLGNLFKTTSNQTDRTELLILLTPRVVANREDAREVTDELRSRVRALAPLEYRIH